MGAENQRFGLAARFFEIINVLTQARFLQPIAGVAGRCGHVVIDLPRGVTVGIDTFMQRMRDADYLIALIF